MLAKKQGLHRLQRGLSYTPAASNRGHHASKHSRPLMLSGKETTVNRTADNAGQQCINATTADRSVQKACADISNCQQQLSAERDEPDQRTCICLYRTASENITTNTKHPLQQPQHAAEGSLQLAIAMGNRSQHQAHVAELSCSQQLPRAPDVAHEQYAYFQFTRQQRLAAAKTIQRHARGLLARLLVQQLQKLRQHAKQRQKHVLVMAMMMWHDHAAMCSNFR